MKNFGKTYWREILVILLIVAVLSSGHLPRVKAQGTSPTLVQQSPTMLNAATKFCTTTATIASQVTCTMTPSGGNYVYITSLDFMACQNATGTTPTTNATFTSTNITGAPVWQISLPATVNLCSPAHTIQLPTPLKSTTPGTAVTLVSPASNATAAYTITASWYEAQ